MKTALITGGSRGIGAAAARLFARRGWGVAVGHCQSGQRARALTEELSGLGVPAMTKVFARLRSMGVDLPASVYTIPQAQEAILAALHRKEGR